MKVFSKKQNGQVLLEIVVATAAAAIVIGLGAQLVVVSLTGNKSAGERDVALGLQNEVFEAVRSVATEKWQDIFSLTKGSTNYYTQTSVGKWVIAAGSENVLVNGINFIRYFTIQNVCRDSSTKDVQGITDSDGAATTCVASGGSYDPSTQKISVTVSWSGANSLVSGDYVTRWRNKTCHQTQWSAASSGVKACPDSTYDSATSIDFTTPGSLKLNSACN